MAQGLGYKIDQTWHLFICYRMSAKTPYKRLTNEDTLRFLNTLWYNVATRIVNKVIEVTDLDEERRDALKVAALRPMDFRVVEESN